MTYLGITKIVIVKIVITICKNKCKNILYKNNLFI